MALEKSYTDVHGVVHTNAYHRVTKLVTDLTTADTDIEVSVYHDAAARTANKQPYEVKAYLVGGADYDTYFKYTAQDTVNKNPQSEAYVYLKTQADYTGALDV